jgi:signal transduction histidine kinase
VLGHDLRNPLGSIVSGLRILQRSPDEAKRAQVMTMMEASAFRMGGLIDNVMDFARTRMGAGLKVPPVEPQSLQPVLEQVIAEFKAVQPHRRIETELSADVPVVADRQRLARLFSNLIGNALVHGDAGKPIRVTASTSEGEFVLSVANEGAAISAEAMDTLFQPFVRGNSENPTGLGLGLYIAKEIARMHGGKLDVASTPDETRFTFSMPTGV